MNKRGGRRNLNFKLHGNLKIFLLINSVDLIKFFRSNSILSTTLSIQQEKHDKYIIQSYYLHNSVIFQLYKL